MISTEKSISLFDKTEMFVCVFDWSGERAFKELKNSFEERFGDKKCYYVGLHQNTENQDDTNSRSDLLILSKKSLSLIGKWKRPEEIELLKSEAQKVVVYFCTDHSKLVNKLSNSMNQGISVGFENEKKKSRRVKMPSS